MYSSSKAAVRGISDVLWMELKPFSITCTHVSAGAICSNIARNAIRQGIILPEDSLYRPYAKQIEQRVWASQGKDSLASEQFAQRVVSETLSRSPPRYITLGGHSTLFWIFSWLPKTWALNILWSKCLKLESRDDVGRALQE